MYVTEITIKLFFIFLILKPNFSKKLKSKTKHWSNRKVFLLIFVYLRRLLSSMLQTCILGSRVERCFKSSLASFIFHTDIFAFPRLNNALTLSKENKQPLQYDVYKSSEDRHPKLKYKSESQHIFFFCFFVFTLMVKFVTGFFEFGYLPHVEVKKKSGEVSNALMYSKSLGIMDVLNLNQMISI
ncbi:hypothetical protein AGLY_004794 [Aphis glycines]|uniref:Uncharacterized protein n=1 Tax=Aphis glycines TaxID=307491 RepID=A0A6G0TUY8_APHGL|nr:hypothetical protein AGLY_004794 [Aphis glycines]